MASRAIQRNQLEYSVLYLDSTQKSILQSAFDKLYEKVDEVLERPLVHRILFIDAFLTWFCVLSMTIIMYI